MKDKSLRVLIIEDSKVDALFIIRELTKGGYDCFYERVETASSMKKAIQEKQWDIVLCDYIIPDFNAPSAIALLKEVNIDIPIIVVSGNIGEETAVECMRLGAQDYIMKGNMSRLCPAIARELEEAKVRNREKHTEEKLRESEKQYRTFFSTSRDCVLITSINGSWIDMNDAAVELFGYSSRDELMQISIPDLYVKKEERTKFINTVMEKGYTKDYPVDMRRKDGGVINALLTSNLRYDANGNATELMGTIKDITERKRAEEALRRSEEKYRTILENIEDGYYEVDLAGNFTFFNVSMCQILGYTQEEMMGMNNRHFTDKEQAKKLFETFNEVYRAGQPAKELDGQIIRKDRTKGYIEVSVSLQKNSSGKPIGFRGIARDITGRKRAEEELRKSEESFRRSLDDSPLGVRIVTEEGKTLYANQATLEIYGYDSIEELRGTFLKNRYTPESYAEFKARKEKRGRGEFGPNEYEINIVRKNGEVRHVQVFRKAVWWNGARQFQLIYQDLTDRKREGEALRESEEQYRLVIENAKESIVIIQDMKLAFVNSAAIGMVGYSKEILTLKSFTDFIHPDDRNMVVDHHIKRIKGEEVPPAYSFRVIGQDGTVIWCEINAVLIQWKGKPATLNFLNNITERKRADEELKESENKYRLLADNVDDIIFVLDMNLNFTYVSPSVKILLGYEPEELLKLQASETMTPSSWDLTTKNLSKIIELEKSEHEEINKFQIIQWEMRRKDGSTVWTEVKASFVRDENQRPVGIIGVSRDITERKKAEEELKQTLESLRKSVGATIQVMVSAIEMRDPYTAGHQLRVADLARTIATEMGFPQEKIEGIRMAGSIHDIGKLSIPAEILSKPTKLTNIEFSLIKEHALSGYEMLKNVESPWPLAQIVYQHHERMDGSGYPRNLKGEEILIEARIMAVADVIEAMASHRPYRPAVGIEAALEEIEKNKGIIYDDAVADTCLKLFREKGYQLK